MYYSCFCALVLNSHTHNNNKKNNKIKINCTNWQKILLLVSFLLAPALLYSLFCSSWWHYLSLCHRQRIHEHLFYIFYILLSLHCVWSFPCGWKVFSNLVLLHWSMKISFSDFLSFCVGQACSKWTAVDS